MAPYRVNLDIFSGPMDLLLYLVRKEEVDIYDIPIARITAEFVRYVEMLKKLDIELAGDFLVMVSTLMEIKSAMLLPSADAEASQEELTDPRAELVRQLLEYKKFKDAANLLTAAADDRSQRYGRPPVIIETLKPQLEPELDMDQVSVWDLLEAFDSLMKATGATLDISRIQDDTPIDLYQIELLHRLQTEGPVTFERLFEQCPGRAVMIGVFLALLELIREGLVWAEQDRPGGTIYLRALTTEPAEQAVQNAMLAAAESDTSGAETQDSPPVPVVEVPAKGRRAGKSRQAAAEKSGG